MQQQQQQAQPQQHAKQPVKMYSKELQQNSSQQDNLIGSVSIMVRYLFNDLQKRPRSFKIGIFTIFLVIGFLSAIQSAFQLAPVIFLKIAEDQMGDQDLLLMPLSFENSTQQTGSSQNSPLGNIRLINSSEVENVCDQVDEIVGCSPRWLVTGEVVNPDNISGQKLKSYVLFINSTQERSVGLGRRLDKKPIEENNALVASSLLRGLGLQVGSKIQLNIDFIKNILQEGQLINIQTTTTSSSSSSSDTLNDTVDAASQFITDFLSQYIEQQSNGALSRNGSSFNVTSKQLRDAVDTFYNTVNELNQTIMGNITEQSLQDLFDQYNISLNVSGSFLGTLLNNTDFFFNNNNTNLTDLAKQLQDLVKQIPENFTANTTELAKQLTPLIVDALRFEFEFGVQDNVNYPRGKWPEQLGNTIVLDVSTLEQDFLNDAISNIKSALSQDSNPALALLSSFVNINDTISSFMQNISISDYALLSEIVVKDRMDIYTDTDTIKQYFINLSNKFYKILGKWHPTQPSIPLATALQAILMMKLFLDNMISAAIFLLAMLSVLLIYSLMISDVEEKTYEFGMLRALGLKQLDLVTLLIMEGLVFALPGLSLGLVMAFHINTVVAQIIFSVGQIVTSYQLHSSAIGLGFGLGILIPLISNYFPIKRALSRSLRDSLDLYHRAVGEISVQVMRLERLGISFAQFLCAMMLILIGLISYYMAPYAFIYNNFKMFLAIINMILIIMILGFVLLLNLGQTYFERMIVRLLMRFIVKQDARLECVVIKNMEGHARRNSKTALMYSIALAFLIFSGTGFNLQNETITDFLMQSLGSDIKLYSPDQNVFLNEQGIREFLEKYRIQYPDDIQAYTFVTVPNTIYPNLPKIKISPLCYFPQRTITIFGIERNFLLSVYPQFYQPTDFDTKISFSTLKDDRKDAVSGIYNKPGKSELGGSMDFYKLLSGTYQRNETKFMVKDSINEQEINMILPKGLEYEVSMDVNTPILLDFNYAQYRGRTVSMAYMMPTFRFSSYRMVAFYAQGIVSTEQYAYMINDYYEQRKYVTGENDELLGIGKFRERVPAGSTYGIPKNQLLIKLNRAMILEEREILINGLRNYITSNTIQLFDTQDIVTSIKSTLFFIDLFSVVVAVIALILSFFLVLVSFTSNIKENSWEFGVLRAIGLNKAEITRCYMYEAAALILASGLIGTVIGIVVAITLTIQILMFIELPFRFIFPTNIFCVTFIMGLAISLLGSYYAIKEFRDKSISTIIKGLF